MENTKVNNENLNKDNILQYIVVRFDKEEYGINIKYIENIIRMTKVTRVPNAPYHIEGVINVRGEIIPVTSIRKKLALENDQITNNTRIIIVQVGEASMGFLVDQVVEVVHLDANHIEKISSDNMSEKDKYLHAVGKQGDRLISLFNVKELISDFQ